MHHADNQQHNAFWHSERYLLGDTYLPEEVQLLDLRDGAYRQRFCTHRHPSRHPSCTTLQTKKAHQSPYNAPEDTYDSVDCGEPLPIETTFQCSQSFFLVIHIQYTLYHALRKWSGPIGENAGERQGRVFGNTSLYILVGFVTY